MSFRQLSVIVAAQNQASSVFSQVAADAGTMGAKISGTSNSVSVLGEEFARTSSQAQTMGQNVQQGSQDLDNMGATVEGTTVKLSTLARGITSVSSLGLGLTTLAGDFGLVDSESSKWMRTGLAMVTVVGEFARLISYSTVLTSGHTAAVALDTTTQESSSIATIASSAAHQVYASACAIATVAENALNISHATFLALTGVGIGVIIAAAAAMAYFASQMNSATSSVQGFNSAASETPGRTRSIQRAGEAATTSSRSSQGNEAVLYRRGIE